MKTISKFIAPLLASICLFTLHSCYVIKGEDLYFTSSDYTERRNEKKVESARVSIFKSEKLKVYDHTGSSKRIPKNSVWSWKTKDDFIRMHKGLSFPIVKEENGKVYYEKEHGRYFVTRHKFYSHGYDGDIIVD